MTPPYPDDDEEEDYWNSSPQSPNRGPLRPTNPTWVRKTGGLVLKTWNPLPLSIPRVDSELGSYNPIQRAAEVFRYMFTKGEYWFSPGGLLREWFRLNIRIALILSIPSLLVAPLVTTILTQVSAWITLLNMATSSLVLLPMSVLLVLGLMCALVYLGRSFQQRARPRQSQFYE